MVPAIRFLGNAEPRGNVADMAAIFSAFVCAVESLMAVGALVAVDDRMIHLIAVIFPPDMTASVTAEALFRNTFLNHKRHPLPGDYL